MDRLTFLCNQMISWNSGDPKRIQHFLKVYSFAGLIGAGEGLSPDLLELTQAAAIVHDIGIRPAEEKYGSSAGKLQEKEGALPARQMALEAGFPAAEADRISYLVGHHHTYENIEGMDYQILVEADFLVNLYEQDAPESEIRSAQQKIFRTETGKQILMTMFGL